MSGTSLVYREQASTGAATESMRTLAVRHDLGSPLPYLTLPDGCVDLIYRIRRDLAGRIDSAALLVAGPTDRPATFFPASGEEFIGIRFAPGWGGFCLGLLPADLFRSHAHARELTPGLARLEEDLFACRTKPEAFARMHASVQAWSAEQPTDRRTLHAVHVLQMGGGRMRVEQAARLAGVSPRSLRRDLRACVGLSPKALLRILRFRRTVDRLNRDGGVDLRDLALQAGYADQAHMTREFQALGGFTPGTPAPFAGSSAPSAGRR